MSTRTLVLSPRTSEESIALEQVARGRGMDVIRAPRWGTSWLEGRSVKHAVVYGECMFAEYMTEALGVKVPVIPDDWVCELPRMFTRRKSYLSTYGAEKARTEPAFMKNALDKSFLSGVYVGSTLPSGFQDDYPLVVQEIVNFVSEYRFFFVHSMVQTYSFYKGVEDEKGLALFMCTLVASGYCSETGMSIDVGRLDTGEWAVIEQNPVRSSAFYGANPEAVLTTLCFEQTP